MANHPQPRNPFIVESPWQRKLTHYYYYYYYTIITTRRKLSGPSHTQH